MSNQLQANYSVKQRIQTIFGNQVSATLSEFNAKFVIPTKKSQNDSILSESTVSSNNNSIIEDCNSSILSNEGTSVQYEFESKCNWRYELQHEECEAYGYITGFVSRIGSSSNSSDRGNINLSTKGNQSKQLLFVNNRFVEYKKVNNQTMNDL